MDYYPPRAKTKFSEQNHLLLLLYRMGPWIRNQLERSDATHNPAIAGLLSFVPGLAHLFLKKGSYKPFIYFGVSIFLGLLAFFMAGGAAGIIFLSALTSFHGYLVLNAYLLAHRKCGRPQPKLPRQMLYSVFFTGMLALWYTGINLQLRKLIYPIRIGTNALSPAINKGDRLLVRPASQFKRGDIVASGNRIEKVIALPGETVEIDKGVIFVNGSPLPREFYPLNDKIHKHPNLRVQGRDMRGAPVGGPARGTVPADSYCVLFPVDRIAGYSGAYLLNHFFMIKKSEIIGKVVYTY